MGTVKACILTLLIAVGLAGCQLPPVSGVGSSPGLERPQGRFAIQGKVEWPAEFEAQATLNDVVSAATVSLIDGISNATIATGLTDPGGNFTLNPSATFNPFEGEVYILEAVKGLNNNQPGHSLARLRTLVQRTKDGYEDVDARIGIVITLKTTTAAYVQSLYSLSPAEMIGFVTESGEYQEKVFADYPTRDDHQLLPRAILNTYHDKVIARALAEDRDPLGALYGHFTVTTIAGTGGQGWQDGPGAQAMFNSMADLKILLEGHKPTLVVLDSANRTLRAVSYVNDDAERGETTVRTILNPLFRSTHTDATASVNPDTGEVYGMGVLASLRGVASMAVFSGGQIVLTDPTSHTIRIAYPDKRTTGARSSNGYCLVTVAGIPDMPGSADGMGVSVDDQVDGSYSESIAQFRAPWGVTVEKGADGRAKDIWSAKIFVADRDNSTVRMLVPRSSENYFDRFDRVSSKLPVYDVYTIAGDPTKGASAPTDLQEFAYVNHDDAALARFNKLNQIEAGLPEALLYGGRQVLYVTETQTNVVRRIWRKDVGNERDTTGWGVETFVGGQGGDRLAYPDPTSLVPLLQTLGNKSGNRGGSRLGTPTDPLPGVLMTTPTSLSASTWGIYVSSQNRIWHFRTKRLDGGALADPLADDIAGSPIGRNATPLGFRDGPNRIADIQTYPLVAYVPVGKWLYFADKGNYRIRRYQYGP